MMWDELVAKWKEVYEKEKHLPMSDFDRLDSERQNENMAQTYVFNIQNVADYLLGGNKEGGMWNYSDFPNVVPPMPNMWMEFRVRGDDGIPQNVGCWIGAIDLSESPELLVDENSVLRTIFKFSKLEIKFLTDPEMGGSFRWMVRSTVWKQLGENLEQIGSMWFLVRRDGSLMDSRLIRYVPTQFALDMMAQMNMDPDKTLMNMMKAANFPVLLALTFSHCKNVKTERLPPPPERLQKSRVSKGKPRLARAHVIVIDPMKKALREGAGQSNYTPGSAQTLHIVRGHFKTFEERPLFGKYKGMFWFPMHVAGSKGFAPKNSYEVKK